MAKYRKRTKTDSGSNSRYLRPNEAPWLLAEFDWTWQTAVRFMRVYEKFKFTNLANLNIAPSALYLLAAPSTPDELREQVIDNAQAGELITHAAVRSMVEEYRPRSTEFANNPATWTHDYSLVDERLTPWPEQPAPEPDKPHVSFNTGNNEWYTPVEYIDAEVQKLGVQQ